jgi:hypothetical protein
VTDPIIAVFYDNAKQTYSVQLRVCSMPAEVYGVLLYDMARQLAAMFAQESSHDQAQVLAAILAYFDKERRNPTSSIEVNRLNS